MLDVELPLPSLLLMWRRLGVCGELAGSRSKTAPIILGLIISSSLIRWPSSSLIRVSEPAVSPQRWREILLRLSSAIGDTAGVLRCEKRCNQPTLGLESGFHSLEPSEHLLHQRNRRLHFRRCRLGRTQRIRHQHAGAGERMQEHMRAMPCEQTHALCHLLFLAPLDPAVIDTHGLWS